MLEISRIFRESSDLDRGALLPVDQTLAGYDPSAHSNDDFYENKLAFQVLLNFPLTTPEERIAGEKWTRRQWAEVRLALRFSRRVPGEVDQVGSRCDEHAGQARGVSLIGCAPHPPGEVLGRERCGLRADGHG
jgi:hypothetical protein